MTGKELAALSEPRRGLGIFSPPTVSEEADALTVKLGTAIGDRVIPVAARTMLGEAIAVMVMYPDVAGRPATQILAESHERWATPEVQAKVRAAKTTDRALAVLREVMEAMLKALGERLVPPEANQSLAMAGAFIADKAAEPI